MVFGQTTKPDCDTGNLQNGAWESKINAREISITLNKSQESFVPLQALSIYEVDNDTLMPDKASYLDVYRNKQFFSGAFGYTQAPLNPEIIITLNNGRPQIKFVVNDICQNLDTSKRSVRYIHKELGEQGQYIVNGKPVARSTKATLQLKTGESWPKVNKEWNADLSVNRMEIDLDVNEILESDSLQIGYIFDDEPMYYLDMPLKGLLELIEQSIKLHAPIAKKLAQNVCEFDDCFVTSATCGYLGLTDGCWELTQLRGFRDNYLMKLPKGGSLVDRYYNNAPKLLKIINRDENKSKVLLSLYFTDILPSAVLAKLKLNKLALWRYKSMMKRLEKQYLDL
jgi:hypothetical protein